jgi:large subunit ribosomal protein L24
MPGRVTRGGTRKKQIDAPRKLHVRRGDRVRVIRGNNAGQEGTILRVLPKENKVVVEGVNMRKRHMRPTQANPEGGIVTFEGPIHVSNVMLLDPKEKEPTRVRARIDKDGMRERISVRSGTAIPRAAS